MAEYSVCDLLVFVKNVLPSNYGHFFSKRAIGTKFTLTSCTILNTSEGTDNNQIKSQLSGKPRARNPVSDCKRRRE